MENVGFLMSVWWLGIESQGNASESPQINKTMLLFFYAVSDRVVMYLVFAFFSQDHTVLPCS